MNADTTVARPPASPLALFLLVAGGAVLAGTWAYSACDGARLVERALATGQGAGSTETAALLRGPALRTSLFTVAAFLFGGAAVVQGSRRAWRERAAQYHRETQGSPWLGWLSALAIVALVYHRTITAGYFRYDDFEFVEIASREPLWSSLWQIHGDHFLPLTRAGFWLAYQLCGVAPLGYNLWLLACLVIVLVLGERLLRELGASTAACGLFVVLVACWSPFAELMTGYYLLSIFLAIAALSLLAAWRTLVWLRQPTARDAGLVAFCAAAAPLIDVSGFYVPAAIGVWLAARGTCGRAEDPRKRWTLAGITLLATSVALAVTWAGYHRTEAGAFLGMAGGAPRSIGRLLLDLGYALDAGLVTTLAVPFVYARLPVAALGSLLAGSAIATIGAAVVAWRHATAARREALLACALIVGGIGVMVVVGRHDAERVAVRWAAKHLGPAFIWLGVLIALGWDGVWRALDLRRALRLLEVTGIAVVLYLLAQVAIGSLGLAVAFPPFGRPAEIRDAVHRREALTFLREEFVESLFRTLGPGASVPNLDGRYLEARWPGLFRYNLSVYRPFLGPSSDALRWIRSPAMQPAAGVTTSSRLRDAVSPAFLEQLRTQPAWRALYFAPVALEPSDTPPAREPEAPATVATTDGTDELVVRADAWDPESAPILQLAFAPRTPGAITVPVDIVFASDLTGDRWQGTLALPVATGAWTSLDLRQVYAFALSREVRALHLRIHSPGTGRFRLAAGTP